MSAFWRRASKIYQGAVIGQRTEVRIDGVVHVRSVLPPNSLVPIKWVAVGNPAKLFPPDKHEDIDAMLAKMDFAGEVYGLERQSGSGRRHGHEGSHPARGERTCRSSRRSGGVAGAASGIEERGTPGVCLIP